MPFRVLIVDDSLTVRMDLQEAFGEAGFEPESCATLEGARQALARRAPALVVLDVRLPDGSGLDLLGELKQDASTRALPVMLLASEAEVRDRLRALGVSADACVDKPYDLDDVLRRARALVAGAPGRLAPLVLVIDDSSTFRETMSELLASAGYAVITAASGEEGLQLAEARRPDVALVDGTLPGINGPTVIQRLRMDGDLRRLPCLILTASDSPQDELLALQAGADAYVQKSEAPEVILARLAALLRTAAAPTSAERTVSASAPKKILAVDDSPTFLQELAHQLQEEGYEIALAHSGEEALALLSRQSVDCILLDLIMPGLSGAEVCRRIKSQPAWRDIPLAILSVADDPAAMIESLDAGADDYIIKGGSFAVLKERMHAQLRRKHFEDENRRIREELLRMELEAAESRAARELAEARALLLADLERKNAELESAKAQAEAATAAKTEFLAQMSHEIRSPLNAIVGLTELIAQSELNSAQAEQVRILRQASDALMMLINDILDLSKVEAGQLSLDLAPFELSELVNRALALVAQRAQEKGLALHCRIAPDAPEWLTGDAHRLLQILNNLLTNAVKFTETGSVTLAFEYADGALRGTVTDTGIGIPADRLGAIFEKFTQATPSITRRYGGTGLGLAITRQLVTAMAGEIRVESELQRGTTFHLTLPLAPASPPAEATPERLPVREEDAPMRILLAEDSPENQLVFSLYLQNTPHRVEIVANGRLALERFKAEPFDLVLMDMHMPEMDGLTAVREIRRWEAETRREPTPILALSASVLQEEIAKSMEAGCDAYLIKPIKRVPFLEAIARHRRPPAAAPQGLSDESLRGMVGTYLANRQQDRLQLEAALASGDLEKLRKIGHTLAGSGAAYGFEEISTLGQALEAAVREANPSAAQQAVEGFVGFLGGLSPERVAEAERRLRAMLESPL